jgi:hypothetical protein
MSIGFKDENERLVAEQAVLVYRSVIDAMHAAPHGKGMAYMEGAVMQGGREHLREILERAASTHEGAQKGGPAVGRARADATPRSTLTPARPSSPPQATCGSSGGITVALTAG